MNAPNEDRSSNIDWEDCPECYEHEGSGICANCEDDGKWCQMCGQTGKCSNCQGTGRSRVEVDTSEVHGNLVVPPGEK